MAVPAHELVPAHPRLAEVLDRHGALVQRGMPVEAPAAGAWSLAELRGRLSELSAGPQPAVLTVAVELVRQVQAAGEPAAWVAATGDLFHAPDVAACGVDLVALPVVRADDAASAGRAADLLLRSGAFALVVIDLGRGGRLATPLQSRLVQLARRHEAAVLCLTGAAADAPSLGSLVSLRAVASRRRLAPGRHACEVTAIKDKRQGPGWRWEGVWHGPDGLA
ncbi:recombinase A [bacterium]|nr:recombinase A [bacterium]